MTKSNNFTSYILVDGKGISVEKFAGTIPDESYVEGWIDLKVDSQHILTSDHWDLIDQLWAYLVDGVTTIEHESDKWDTSFPDQPLRLALQRFPDGSLKVSLGESESTVSYRSFRNCIANGGLQFFQRLKDLMPDSSDVWEEYISRCKKLLRK